MLEHRRLVSFEVSLSLRCQYGAGRCDKDLQESFLPSSWRSSRITWGCQVVVAAYVWAAESRLGIQAPKEDLNHSIKSVYSSSFHARTHQLARHLRNSGVCWPKAPWTLKGACTCSWRDLTYCRHLNSDVFICNLNPTPCVSPFLFANGAKFKISKNVSYLTSRLFYFQKRQGLLSKETEALSRLFLLKVGEEAVFGNGM